MRPARTIAALGGLGGLGLAFVAGCVVESRAYTLRRFELPVLPAGTPTLRVLHLSDLHLTDRQRLEREWVRGLAALEPDLVVDTGDNLAHLDAVPNVLRALEPLLERPGAFVLGSNDYFAPKPKNPARYLLPDGGRRRIAGRRLPTDRLVEGLTAQGWLDLTNTRGQLRVAGVDLSFVGVDDPHLGYDRFPAPDHTAPAALAIGVSHAPYTRVLDAMVRDGASLLLAGHTHGGQLRLPGYGTIVTNCDLDRHRARGVSRWWDGAAHQPPQAPPPPDAAWLHVSAGLGTSPYTPVRFNCRPEASLLTLTAP
ncbi:metallophosphoesterase [Angustibacter sp. Root456]|uniref:metallophosphoesterase n=1 Tax=Angustibacter sp. Root456 TaxID=1736539 RepID=UPI0006F338FA|nr:metallophosphoesterase [Angustibacter sp. Root456]KQX61669.1 metallophosphoesterase [Angustibacter sp. Root456]